MAELNYEDGGFITRFNSSPYDIIECLHIRLVLWNDYPSLSSENFEEVYVKISANKDKYNFWDSYRSDYDNDTPFIFPQSDCDDPMIFNTIFYLKESGEPAGYTQFLETQSTEYITELWIYTHFRYSSEISDLILSNSLESHIYENFLGNLDVARDLEDTKYATRKNIDSIYVETYQRFTNIVDHVVSDKNYSILTNSLLYSNPLKGRVNLQSVFTPYDNVTIGIYNDDIVACTWNSYLYRSISLTKVDDHGDPVVYYSGNIRTSTTSGGFGLKDYTIKSMNPYCVLCYTTYDPQQEVALIVLEDNVLRIKNSYEEYVQDPYSVRGGYIVNNTTITSMTLAERIESPELYKRVVCSVYNGEIPGKLVRIEGSFCVFEGDGVYYYSNLEGRIIADRDNLKVLNDCCLFDQDETNLKFYFTYNNSEVHTDGTTEDKYKYLVYEVARDDLRNPLISSLRRNKIDYESIPNIVSTYGSILFYKDSDNYLKYV